MIRILYWREFGIVLTFGDGTTENVFMILSGYSSRIFDIKRVPIPEPVPPPKEWAVNRINIFVIFHWKFVYIIRDKPNWNPWRQSHVSDSLRITSRTESKSSAPSV